MYERIELDFSGLQSYTTDYLDGIVSKTSVDDSLGMVTVSLMLDAFKKSVPKYHKFLSEEVMYRKKDKAIFVVKKVKSNNNPIKFLGMDILLDTLDIVYSPTNQDGDLFVVGNVQKYLECMGCYVEKDLLLEFILEWKIGKIDITKFSDKVFDNKTFKLNISKSIIFNIFNDLEMEETDSIELDDDFDSKNVLCYLLDFPVIQKRYLEKYDRIFKYLNVLLSDYSNSVYNLESYKGNSSVDYKNIVKDKMRVEKRLNKLSTMISGYMDKDVNGMIDSLDKMVDIIRDKAGSLIDRYDSIDFIGMDKSNLDMVYKKYSSSKFKAKALAQSSHLHYYYRDPKINPGVKDAMVGSIIDILCMDKEFKNDIEIYLGTISYMSNTYYESDYREVFINSILEKASKVYSKTKTSNIESILRDKYEINDINNSSMIGSYIGMKNGDFLSKFSPIKHTRGDSSFSVRRGLETAVEFKNDSDVDSFYLKLMTLQNGIHDNVNVLKVKGKLIEKALKRLVDIF